MPDQPVPVPHSDGSSLSPNRMNEKAISNAGRLHVECKMCKVISIFLVYIMFKGTFIPFSVINEPLRHFTF